MEISQNKRRAPKQKIGTTLTFSAEEMMALARYLAAGTLLLQTNHPVTGRIKGALTRLGLQSPKGARTKETLPAIGAPH